MVYSRDILYKTGLIALFLANSVFGFAQQSTSSSPQRPTAPIKVPQALRPDIQIEKVMDIGRLGVRLIYNEKTNEFWYTTFDGNIFRIPINAKNLLLSRNEAQLKADGYLYAQGIRNAFDMAFDGNKNLFGLVNSGDYDQSEEMFWIRKGHHYGFPWQMAGIENPQQFSAWIPDPTKDPFISPGAHSWIVKYFRNDPEFPKIPEGVKFSPGVQNMGPDANEYRDIATGKIVDGDITGKTVSTFNAHSVPLGLVFDTKNKLSSDFTGDGFAFRYGGGSERPGTNLLRKSGKDLLHLEMTYNAAADNFYMKTTAIANNFNAPVDAVLLDNHIYVLEHGTANSAGGRIWKITLPKK